MIFHCNVSNGILTIPEVVSISVTIAEFLLGLVPCWKSVDPPTAWFLRLRLLIQKQQLLIESRKCWQNSKISTSNFVWISYLVQPEIYKGIACYIWHCENMTESRKNFLWCSHKVNLFVLLRFLFTRGGLSHFLQCNMYAA